MSSIGHWKISVNVFHWILADLGQHLETLVSKNISGVKFIEMSRNAMINLKECIGFWIKLTKWQRNMVEMFKIVSICLIWLKSLKIWWKLLQIPVISWKTFENLTTRQENTSYFRFWKELTRKQLKKDNFSRIVSTNATNVPDFE